MSKYLNIPKESQGSLHRPELERDSCGVGFVAHINGERSHRVLRLGLDSVCNVTHRGAVDADGKTGDGAGVTTQLPYQILVPEVAALGGKLENDHDLGVGVFFLPLENEAEQMKGKILAELGSPLDEAMVGLVDAQNQPREFGRIDEFVGLMSLVDGARAADHAADAGTLEAAGLGRK